ncbi:MAG: hypothetical protein ABIZ49_13000 [Opitutaceae bacterium]
MSKFAYHPVLSGKVSSFIVGTSKARQKKIIALVFRISDYPSQLGDYATRDENGREIQHLLLGDWQFSFWADHAVRELRFTEIAEL